MTMSSWVYNFNKNLYKNKFCVWKLLQEKTRSILKPYIQLWILTGIIYSNSNCRCGNCNKHSSQQREIGRREDNSNCLNLLGTSFKSICLEMSRNFFLSKTSTLEMALYPCYAIRCNSECIGRRKTVLCT